MKRLPVACLIVLCIVAVAPAPARAQVDSREGIALQNQIAELRAQMQAMRDQMVRGGGQSGGSALGGSYQQPAPPPVAGNSDLNAQLLDRVQRLEDQVRALRGHIDEIGNARQRDHDDLAKQIADMQFQMSNGGAGGAPPPAPAPGPKLPPLSPPAGNLATPAPGADAGAVPPPRLTPEMLLQQGNNALARRDYAAAETAAKTALAAGKGPRLTDAQFLLAQALYGKRDFADAAVAYDDAYNRARTGTHAQDSLLGLANAMNALAEKRAACQTLDKLAAQFPTLRPDLKAPAATARRDAGCR